MTQNISKTTNKIENKWKKARKSRNKTGQMKKIKNFFKKQ